MTISLTHRDSPGSKVFDHEDGTITLCDAQGNASERKEFDVDEFKALGWIEESPTVSLSALAQSLLLEAYDNMGVLEGTEVSLANGWAGPGVRRVASAKGVARFHKPEGTIITKKMIDDAKKAVAAGKSKGLGRTQGVAPKDRTPYSDKVAGAKNAPSVVALKGKLAAATDLPSGLYGNKKAKGAKLHIYKDGTVAVEDGEGNVGQRQAMDIKQFEALGWEKAGPAGIKPPPKNPGDASKALQAEMKVKHPDVEMHLTPVGDSGSTVSVKLLRVPEELRGQGKAKYAMADLVKAADRENVRLSITPEPVAGDHKTHRTKLVPWMKELGFKNNTGSNKDFEINDTMHREPGASIKASALIKKNPVIPPKEPVKPAAKATPAKAVAKPAAKATAKPSTPSKPAVKSAPKAKVSPTTKAKVDKQNRFDNKESVVKPQLKQAPARPFNSKIQKPKAAEPKPPAWKPGFEPIKTPSKRRDNLEVNGYKYHKATPQEFHDAVAAAQEAKGTRGAFLSLYSVDEYAGMRTFLAEDGKVGAALKSHPDGKVEMVSLFNNGGSRGAGMKMVDVQIHEGGNYLEAYGDTLKGMYAGKGFQVTASYPFDRSLAAPNWDYKKYGTPDYNEMSLPKATSTAKPVSIGKIARDLVDKESAQGQWGASHSGSFALSGASAQLMGIKGYKTFDEDHSVSVQNAFVAAHFLREIHDGKTTGGRRFHGTSGKQWDKVKPGDTVDLPLTATADWSTSALGYGATNRDQGDGKLGYLVVFPDGTPGAGVSESEDINTSEVIPGKWDEMIVAGKFRVKSRTPVSNSEGQYTRIEVEPTALFNVDKQEWTPIDPPKAQPDYGHPDIVGQLLDQAAQINSDGTVSVWTTRNLNRHEQHNDPVSYTTSKDEAVERGSWSGGIPAQELRIPLGEVQIKEIYGGEARVALPESMKNDPAVSAAMGHAATEEAKLAHQRGQDMTSWLMNNGSDLQFNADQLHVKSGDARLTYVATQQGYGAVPATAPKEAIDAAVKSGWTEAFRGVKPSDNGSVSASDILASMRGENGIQYEVGTGIYGNGSYASVNINTADSFAGSASRPDYQDGVQRMAINPDAKVISWEDAKIKRNGFLAQYVQENVKRPDGTPTPKYGSAAWNDYWYYEGSANLDPNVSAVISYSQDEGRFAALLGYDIMKITGQDDGATGKADQYAILNRTAVLLEQAGPKGDVVKPAKPTKTALVTQVDVRKAETGGAK